MNRNDTHSLKEALSALADNEPGGNEGTTESELIELACRDQEAMLAWQSTHLTRDVLQADYTAALRPDFAALVSQQIAAEPALQANEYTADSRQVVSLAEARSARRPDATPDFRPDVARRAAASSSQQNEPFKLWKPVAGLGLAASLAGATLLFSQLLQTEQPGGSLVADTSSTTGEVQNVASQNSSQNSNQNVDINSGSTGVGNNDVETLQASVRMENRGTRWRMDSDLPRNKQIEQRLNTLLTNHLEDARMGRVTGMMSHSRVVGYDSIQGDQ